MTFGAASRADGDVVLKMQQDQIKTGFYNCSKSSRNGTLELQQERMVLVFWNFSKRWR
jgi:hypothetical protein